MVKIKISYSPRPRLEPCDGSKLLHRRSGAAAGAVPSSRPLDPDNAFEQSFAGGDHAADRHVETRANIPVGSDRLADPRGAVVRPRTRIAGKHRAAVEQPRDDMHQARRCLRAIRKRGRSAPARRRAQSRDRAARQRQRALHRRAASPRHRDFRPARAAPVRRLPSCPFAHRPWKRGCHAGPVARQWR